MWGEIPGATLVSQFQFLLCAMSGNFVPLHLTVPQQDEKMRRIAASIRRTPYINGQSEIVGLLVPHYLDQNRKMILARVGKCA